MNGTLSLMRRLAFRAVLVGPDRRGQWGSRCPMHGYTEAWPSKLVARVACLPEHVRDWCPGCAADGR
jgi:hypothetical protein